MQDTDFERKSEKMRLLTNEGYFARHRELSQQMSSEAAWEQVESELPFGLRRFNCIESFKKGRKMVLSGKNPTPRFVL